MTKPIKYRIKSNLRVILFFIDVTMEVKINIITNNRREVKTWSTITAIAVFR